MPANTTIVACDDDAFIRRSIELKFSRAGYDIHMFPNGEKAWEAIQTLQPKLVITDMQMPRMTGAQLCIEMAANPETASIPIILLTAKAFEVSSLVEVMRGRDMKLLPKPFGPTELLNLSTSLLENAEIKS